MKNIILFIIGLLLYLAIMDFVQLDGMMNVENEQTLICHNYYTKSYDSLTNEDYLKIVDYDNVFITKHNRLLYRYSVTNHGGVLRYSKLDSIIYQKFKKL